MLLALSAEAASAVSKEIMSGGFKKEYLAVLHGSPGEKAGTLRDLLARDKRERKTYVAAAPGKGVQEAALNYSVLAEKDGLSLVKIELLTGRTHQIRAQFSSRSLPIVGDRKYSLFDDGCDIALWSYSLSFTHPASGESMSFSHEPPGIYPWQLFRSEAD
jgi:23S rRNA pseudouridine1911/1915/1917 synthase